MMLIVTMMTKTTIEMAALVVLATFPHAKCKKHPIGLQLKMLAYLSPLLLRILFQNSSSIFTITGQFGAQFVHEISPWCGVVGDWVLDWIHQAPLQDIDYATMIVRS